MSKVVNFQRQKPRRAGGIPTILAAMGVAGAAGYFGPGLVEKLPLPSGAQLVASISADTIAGRASVIDGDTIEIHGERIRFNGIDAPESAQLCTDVGGRMYRCGARSAEALSEWLAASSPTTCKFVGPDQYDRFVGNCTRADGASVQSWLVRKRTRHGLAALFERRFSKRAIHYQSGKDRHLARKVPAAMGVAGGAA